jgi:hypothetical protein
LYGGGCRVCGRCSYEILESFLLNMFPADKTVARGIFQ